MSVNVTPDMVKALRLKTDAGMLDCKNALIEANGDQVEAEKILKVKGLASAAKRADRAAAEGKIFNAVSATKMAMVEISCETDFVAKTDQFTDLGKKACDSVLATGAISTDVDSAVKEATLVLKENMTIKRFVAIDLASDKAVAFYSHNDGMIGVAVEAKVSEGKANDTTILAFLKDCAMHIVANNPLFLNSSKIDSAYIAEQEDIFVKQTIELGKPADMAKQIASGKLKKHLAEICFVDQPFVKDPSVSVAKKAEAIAKETGSTIEFINFTMYRVGSN